MTLPDDAKRKIEARAEAYVISMNWPYRPDAKKDHIVGATEQFLESQGEIERLTAELEFCEQLAEIRSILITNLNEMNDSKDQRLSDAESQLKELREAADRMLKAIKQMRDPDKDLGEGMDLALDAELTYEEYRKKNSISNVSGVGIQKI